MANYLSELSGEKVDELLSSVNVSDIASGTDLNNITERGFYRIESSTIFDTLVHKPNNIVNAGALLIIMPFQNDNSNVIQVLIMNIDSVMFIRRKSWTGSGYSFGAWCGISIRNESLHRTGTTAHRPSIPSNQSYWFIGDFYFDTDLGKPIWWTGDTSDGKTGWVDATGASV